MQIPGGQLAIYRTRYYTDVSIGVGGRVTIPQGLRDDLRLAAKDSLTVRVEETSDGRRQMVIWRSEEQEEA